MLLLSDSDLVQTLPLDLGSLLTSACCTDPHLAVLPGQAGQAAAPGKAKSSFLAISPYRDMSGLLNSQVIREEGRQADRRTQELDEEDELLYGSADAGGGGGGCRTRARRRKSPG